MSYWPLVPAQLAFNDAGIPYAPTYDDIYHSDSGGLEQARRVFIAGNDVAAAWQGRDQFTILETGFGLGLNFLATWQAWRDDPLRCARLHFVSVENHPFIRRDLTHLHQRWPELTSRASELQTHWPPLTPGIHRLLLNNGCVTLTLLFGDAATQLRKLSLQADALYLDGFAPNKNPKLWDLQFFKAVTRLCKPGATLATWTVAAAVREALTAQRWSLEKRPGFGSKRDMLAGRLYSPLSRGPSPSRGNGSKEKHAIVIGAGIAGTSVAERLGARGWHIDLLERHSAPASEASGNPLALLHPMLARDDNLAARLSRAGYLYSLRLLQQLDTEDIGLHWDRCGILQLARDATQDAEQRATTDALRFPDDYVAYVDHAKAANIAGTAVSAGGWFYPNGAIVNPPSLCHALLQRHATLINARFSTEVAQLKHDGTNWQALDSSGMIIATAPVVIVAGAFEATRLLPQQDLNLSRLRGQISLLPKGSVPALPHAICGNGYVTPATLGNACIGASFDMDDDDTSVREDGHRFNLERLAELLPDVDVSRIDPAQLKGRVGFRTIALDRMPIVGALPDASMPLRPGARLRDVPRLPGLCALLALGSRGLSWGPLAAELLAAQLNSEPLPLERDLINAIDPGRFVIRQQRRKIAAAPDL